MLCGKRECRTGLFDGLETCLGVDGVNLFAVLFTYRAAAGKDNLFCKHNRTLDDVLDRGVRHVVAGYVDIPVVERFGPVLEGHCTVKRNSAKAVDYTQEAAHCGGLVVAVKAKGAADEKGLLDVAVSVEE